MSQGKRSVSKRPKNAAQAIVPFDLIDRHVMLSVRVNNSRMLKFLLDTGNKFAIIDLDRARELKLSLQREVKVAGAGSQIITGYFVRDSSFTIAGLKEFSQPITLAFPLKNLASVFRAGP